MNAGKRRSVHRDVVNSCWKSQGQGKGGEGAEWDGQMGQGWRMGSR